MNVNPQATISGGDFPRRHILHGRRAGTPVSQGLVTSGGSPRPVAPQALLDACSVASRRMNGPSLTCIGVTSSVRREGRSTIAVAMAAIQAFEYDRKTLLAELDFDKPSLAKTFALDPTQPGVAEVLRDEVSTEECIQLQGDNLAVMVAGNVDEAGKDLLRSSASDTLIERLTGLAEVLVLDLPPLSPGTSGVKLADLCETVALVVRAGAVSKGQVQMAASTLARPVFLIMNGTRSATPTWARRFFGMAP